MAVAAGGAGDLAGSGSGGEEGWDGGLAWPVPATPASCFFLLARFLDSMAEVSTTGTPGGLIDAKSRAPTTRTPSSVKPRFTV